MFRWWLEAAGDGGGVIVLFLGGSGGTGGETGPTVVFGPRGS